MLVRDGDMVYLMAEDGRLLFCSEYQGFAMGSANLTSNASTLIVRGFVPGAPVQHRLNSKEQLWGNANLTFQAMRSLEGRRCFLQFGQAIPEQLSLREILFGPDLGYRSHFMPQGSTPLLYGEGFVLQARNGYLGFRDDRVVLEAQPKRMWTLRPAVSMYSCMHGGFCQVHPASPRSSGIYDSLEDCLSRCVMSSAETDQVDSHDDDED